MFVCVPFPAESHECLVGKEYVYKCKCECCTYTFSLRSMVVTHHSWKTIIFQCPLMGPATPVQVHVYKCPVTLQTCGNMSLRYCLCKNDILNALILIHTWHYVTWLINNDVFYPGFLKEHTFLLKVFKKWSDYMGHRGLCGMGSTTHRRSSKCSQVDIWSKMFEKIFKYRYLNSILHNLLGFLGVKY